MFRNSGDHESVFHNCSSEKTPYLSHSIPIVAALPCPAVASAEAEGVGLALPLENIADLGMIILMKTAEFGFSWGRENRNREYRLSGLFTAG